MPRCSLCAWCDHNSQSYLRDNTAVSAPVAWNGALRTVKGYAEVFLVDSLKNARHLNGTLADLRAFDEQTQRYEVHFFVNVELNACRIKGEIVQIAFDLSSNTMIDVSNLYTLAETSIAAVECI